MEAFANGKTIQYRRHSHIIDDKWCDDKWCDVGDLLCSVNCVYRIKPEPPKPRELWVCDSPNLGVLSFSFDEENAKDTASKYSGIKVARFVEVLE